MTTEAITTAARPPAPTESFTRLVQELVHLDYARVDSGEVDRDDYTRADSRTIVGIKRDETPHRAHLSTLDEHGDPAWTLTLTATTPEPAQLVALYTVLHHDIGDERAIVRSLADAFNVAPAAIPATN